MDIEATRIIAAGDGIPNNDLIAGLTALLGADNIVTDRDEIAILCQDIYEAGPVALAVVRPGTRADVAAVARLAHRAGVALVPRGGGLSYTGGYLPDRGQSIMVDMARLDRIVSVDLPNMAITVEPGCTWAQVREALLDARVRPPYWGPLSGLRSTVGGAASQNSVFFGSGIHGTAADSVIGLEVVLGDGTVVTTGSGANVDGIPFFRHYGPDLTGLFLGDCGAFGLKTAITLRLIPEPRGKEYASFAFGQRSQLVTAMTEISRRGLAVECFTMDPFLQEQRLKRASVIQDLKSLAGVIGGAGSLAKGMLEGAKVALAGRNFAKDAGHCLHITVEQFNEAAAVAAMDEIRQIAKMSSGREIENSIPKIIGGRPFTPPNTIIGPNGERWVPVHGIVPHSRAEAALAAIDALRAEHAAEIERHDIGIGCLMVTIGCSATLIEPVFFWPDALLPMHRRIIGPEILSKITEFPDAPESRAVVHKLRKSIADIFRRQGGSHFQIGKSYPLRDGMQPATWALLTAIKQAVDPQHLMNPGTLGLE